jgi:hypothetical protein
MMESINDKTLNAVQIEAGNGSFVHIAVDEDGMAEFSKELAKLTYERRYSERMIVFDEHSSAFKWLMASLLTVNSGALFALVSAETRPSHFYFAVACFWLGLAGALGIAWRSQAVNRQYIQKLAEVEQVYAVTSVYGFIDPVEADAKEKSLNDVTARSPKIFGWLSFTAFSVGLLISIL